MYVLVYRLIDHTITQNKSTSSQPQNISEHSF